MNLEIYCDESCLEAFFDKDAHKYIAIGGIWLPADKRSELKEGIQQIKDKFNIKGEFKWNKLSPKYYDFYKALVDYFFASEYLRFRAIIIESDKVDNIHFHNSDNELSFYKFYYQLIHHWILDLNTYNIFLDYKINRNKGRLKELKKVLSNANLTSTIENVQGLPSEQSLGIQLADVLTGIVSAKFNNIISSPAKLDLIKHIETVHLKKTLTHTPKGEEKFNVFQINLQGGW
jgi:hypothetical protein